MKKKSLIVLLLPIIILLAFLTPKVYAKKTDVGFIYYYEPDTESFKFLLDNNGFSTDLINISTINAGMLEDYDIIILGPKTGVNGTWRGTTSQISIIDGTKNPIIGLGNGGYAFFGSEGLNLSIGYDLGGHQISTVEIEVLDSSHKIFTSPHKIPNGIVKIYASGWYADISIFLKQKCYYVTLPNIPADVQVLAKIPGSDDCYSLVSQQNRYFLWGFVQNPGYMNPTGEDLFINVVSFYVPEAIPGFNMFIIIGIISVSTMILLKKQLKN